MILLRQNSIKILTASWVGDNTDPLNSEYTQINLEFLDPNDDREFIDYLNSLDNPNNFDDFNDWSDDVDLFMEGLCNPHMIDELCQK